MNQRGVLCAAASPVLALALVVPAVGQTGGSNSAARVETARIDIIRPERYQIPVVFEPIRRVAIMATGDGIVTSTPVPIGSMVRENQELIQLDRAEAAANVKVADAEVAEREATLTGASNATYQAIYKAQVEAAKAKAELARIALDRCTLKAPFPGRLLAYLVSPGQYVVKGTNLGDLADVSTLRVLVPVDRSKVKEGDTIDLLCEGKTVPGKVQTVLPLHEGFSVLRELATPWAAAWVHVDSGKGLDLEQGQRVRSPYLPNAPITALPARSVRNGASGPFVQVVRNEHVADVPVQVLGPAGLDRTQVAGMFWPYDVAIVESNPPLVAGTYLRFGGENAGGGVQGTPPDPNQPGQTANVSAPGGAGTTAAASTTTAPSTGSSRVAPVGSPGRSTSTAGASKGTTTRPATKPSTKPAAPPAAPANTGAGAVPF